MNEEDLIASTDDMEFDVEVAIADVDDEGADDTVDLGDDDLDEM